MRTPWNLPDDAATRGEQPPFGAPAENRGGALGNDAHDEGVRERTVVARAADRRQRLQLSKDPVAVERDQAAAPHGLQLVLDPLGEHGRRALDAELADRENRWTSRSGVQAHRDCDEREAEEQRPSRGQHRGRREPSHAAAGSLSGRNAGTGSSGARSGHGGSFAVLAASPRANGKSIRVPAYAQCVASRDVLVAEVGAAFGILGLLLVFLPLFLKAFERALDEQQPYAAVRAIGFRAYFVAGTIAFAAAVATVALLALWLRSDPLAVLAGVGLVVVTWSVVILAGMAVWRR
jgi:hypothetical protein